MRSTAGVSLMKMGDSYWSASSDMMYLYSSTGQMNAAWMVNLSFLCHSAFQYQVSID